MELIDVYEYPGADDILYRLLEERDHYVNISHRKMPSWDEHIAFMRSRPYREWFIIVDGHDTSVGAIYLSRQNEIGVFVFDGFRGQGNGSWAVRTMIERHAEERLLANIAPLNSRSMRMFEGLGFRLCQLTYERNDHENQ